LILAPIENDPRLRLNHFSTILPCITRCSLLPGLIKTVLRESPHINYNRLSLTANKNRLHVSTRLGTKKSLQHAWLVVGRGDAPSPMQDIISSLNKKEIQKSKAYGSFFCCLPTKALDAGHFWREYMNFMYVCMLLDTDCIFFPETKYKLCFFQKLNAHYIFFINWMHIVFSMQQWRIVATAHISVTRSMCASAHSDRNHGSPCRWAHNHHCTCTPTALPSPQTPDDTTVAVRVAGCSSPRSLFSVMRAGGDHVPEHMLSRVRWSRAFILIYIYICIKN
jgi:hypothetical protein